MKIYMLDSAEAIEYLPFIFQAYKPYLLNYGRDNITAVGAKDDDGSPCGLILALTTVDQNGNLDTDWTLLSVYVKDTLRRKGIGRGLWQRLCEELRSKGGRRVRVQAVLRETVLEAVEAYLPAIGFSAPERIAKIFSFSPDSMNRGRSPFVNGSLAGVFQPDERFRFLSFDELTGRQTEELEKNEGNWYPPFVSPLIGKEQFNRRSTIFAVDGEKDKIAGWITGINVNNDTRILYRSFFTREEYRDTPVGFFIFTQAMKNHLREFPERGGLASIPTDNDRAMRFSTLFFRDSYDHISYEITSEYRLEPLYMDDEPFVSVWEKAGEGIYPIFAAIDFKQYKSLKTDLFQSFAGRIPVMHMKDRQEFEDLICQIFYKGEKRDIPSSMGALTVRGWKDIFGRNHRAVLLSDGYYSAVLPEEAGLSPEDWKEKSLIIRRTHELAHYYTLRAFGFMNTALKDELIADTMGIIEAFGQYRRDLFLQFMGLENYPEYRLGGRLQNYGPKDREMTDGEFKEFQKAAYEASGWLEALIRENPHYLESEAGKLDLLNKLAGVDANFFEKGSKDGGISGK